MTWFFLSLLAALSQTIGSLIQKKSLFTERTTEYTTLLVWLIAIGSVPFLFFIDYGRIPLLGWACIILLALADAVAFGLATKSMKHMEISSASPLFMLGPGITAVSAYVIIGESLSRLQVAGLVTLLIGSYVLETKSGDTFWKPLITVFRSKYIHYILYSLLIYGGMAVVEKIMLNGIGVPVLAYLPLVNIGIAVFISIYMGLTTGKEQSLSHAWKTNGWQTVLVALFTLGYRLPNLFAFTLAPVGLVTAIKRTSSVLTTILGGEIFKEHDILRKTAGCLVMLAGVILVAWKG